MGNKVTKKELIARMAEKTEGTKKDAAYALDGIIDCITEALVAGDSVTIKGFGTFDVKDSAARAGVNPATGEAIAIPAKKRVACKFSKILREKVNA